MGAAALKSTTFALAGLLAVWTLCAGAQASDALEAGRERWRTAAVADYEYGYRKFCECHPDTPPETVVTVRSDAVVGVRHRPVGYTEEVPADQKNLEFYWTVDGLFGLVESALGRGATVRVLYDDTLGYPREIYIDYDANFIGDEVDLKLTGVTPLR
jgi:hypothetical protein